MVGDSVATDITSGLAAGFHFALMTPRTEVRVPSDMLRLDGFFLASEAIDRLLGVLREVDARSSPGGFRVLDDYSGGIPTSRCRLNQGTTRLAMSALHCKLTVRIEAANSNNDARAAAIENKGGKVSDGLKSV